jgi:hypothetical protein
VAVLLLGGLGLTVPPQTRDMLSFLDGHRAWAALVFQLALLVLGGSAWFWSRAALAARFGIDDRQRRDDGANSGFDWTAFSWLPRLVLLAAFLVGAVIAFRGRSPWTIAGAIALGVLAVLLAVFRPRWATVTLPPAPRGGLQAWLRGLEAEQPTVVVTMKSICHEQNVVPFQPAALRYPLRDHPAARAS